MIQLLYNIIPFFIFIIDLFYFVLLFFNHKLVPGYLGCYIDQVGKALTVGTRDNAYKTLNSCLEYCSALSPELRFAGVSYGHRCECGYEDAEYDRAGGRLWDTYCDYPCGGNDEEKCGGYGKISIYDCK